MRAAGQADCFVVVNGPEDGTEFPVVRAPFHIGHDRGCTVNVRLDKGVDNFHALVTVVSDGYRIRRTGGRPVFVNGRPAGPLKSEIVRDGGMVQVGQTLLILDCSPDGLARRSRGIVSESDFGWAFQRVLAGLWRGVARFAGLTGDLVRQIITSWWAMAGIAVVLYIVWPQFRWWVQWLVMWVWMRITDVI